MLNKIQLIGHLGRDPELAFTPTGKAVARFSLAVSRPRSRQQAEQRDDTQWFSIVAWERLAETCERLLHTGDKVYVEGRIGSHTYTDRDGMERTAWEVTAQDVELLERRRSRAELDDHAQAGEVAPPRAASSSAARAADGQPSSGVSRPPSARHAGPETRRSWGASGQGDARPSDRR
jgi:single-strand DNA-binding protein